MSSRRILFISKYQKVVYEFLNAMGENELSVEIDTASNGTDAIDMLRQKEYQVVVTGLALDGYNGEQVITYLNQNFPNVVCIIYTTNISAAQLHFFINERNVFRVFLRPVDYRREFFLALEEAFEYYEVRMKEQEEAVAQEETFEEQKEGIKSFERRIESQERSQRMMERYMRRLTLLTIKEYGGLVGANAAGVTQAEMERLVRCKNLEWKTVSLCCMQDEEYESHLAQAEKIAAGIRALNE